MVSKPFVPKCNPIFIIFKLKQNKNKKKDDFTSPFSELYIWTAKQLKNLWLAWCVAQFSHIREHTNASSSVSRHADGLLSADHLIYWKHVPSCSAPINLSSRAQVVNELLVKHECRGQGITTRDIVHEKHVRSWRGCWLCPRPSDQLAKSEKVGCKRKKTGRERVRKSREKVAHFTMSKGKYCMQ